MICDQVRAPYLLNAYKQQISDNDIESSWSDANEKLAFYIATKVKQRMRQHFRLYRRNDLIHKCVMYPVIALSTVVGTVNYNTDQSYMKYIISSINIANALLLSYIKFSNLGQLSEAHNQSYIHYDLLYRKIVRELVHEPRERTHARELLDEVSERYDDLLKLCPTISENGSISNTTTQVRRMNSTKTSQPEQKADKGDTTNFATTESMFRNSRLSEWQNNLSSFDTMDQTVIKTLSKMRDKSRPQPLSHAQYSWKTFTAKLVRLHTAKGSQNEDNLDVDDDDEENPIYRDRSPQASQRIDNII